MNNLNTCKIGKLYTIDAIGEQLPLKIRRRMYDLGFINGQKIKVVRKSLLKKAILIEIRGYTLSLRSTIAEFIYLKS